MALKIRNTRNSLVVQWLGLQVLTAEDQRSIPGQKLRSHKLQVSAKKKKEKEILTVALMSFRFSIIVSPMAPAALHSNYRTLSCPKCP